jgi:trk system potassium uptake protein TrkH
MKNAAFAQNIPFLSLTILLIIIGELGFITWHELGNYAKAWLAKTHFKLSLHSRIVLSYSALLAASTALLFFALEYANTLSNDSLSHKIFTTFFNVISFRSCGFSTIPIGAMHLATIFLIMMITFIGASPGSTGSGIKITSFALVLATLRSVITGRGDVEMRGRRLPNDQVFKVMAVFTLAIMWIAFSTFLLLITESTPNASFLTVFFEAVSAFANLGITVETTAQFSIFGKIIVMTSMVLGRIGALTLILALKKHKELTAFQYPEERVMLS